MEKKNQDTETDFVGRTLSSLGDVWASSPAPTVRPDPYVDRAHFLYELLDNAERAGAQKVRFSVLSDRLEFCHDGKPFTEADLCGLLRAVSSAGMAVSSGFEAGLFCEGFSSVFTICKYVKLYSEPSNYRYRVYLGGAEPFAINISVEEPKDVQRIEKTDSCMGNCFTTKFVFTYAGGESYSGYRTIQDLVEDVEDKIMESVYDEMPFLKSITALEYETGPLKQDLSIKVPIRYPSGTFSFSRSGMDVGSAGPECTRVNVRANSDGSATNPSDFSFYIVFSERHGESGSEARRPVGIAYRIKDNSDRLKFISADTTGFSTCTDSSEKPGNGLNFIVRRGQDILSCPDTQSALDGSNSGKTAFVTAGLFKESLLVIRDRWGINLRFIEEIMPLNAENPGNGFMGGGDGTSLYSFMHDASIELFKNERVLLCVGGGYVKSTEALLPVSDRIVSTFSSEDISSLLGTEGVRWLNTDVKEIRKSPLYGFLVSELEVRVISPDDLISALRDNVSFLETKADDAGWLDGFYAYLDERPDMLKRKRGGDGTMLNLPFVKTRSGAFAAPYEYYGGSKYVQAVYVPEERSGGTYSGYDEVDASLFEGHWDFFVTKLKLTCRDGSAPRREQPHVGDTAGEARMSDETAGLVRPDSVLLGPERVKEEKSGEPGVDRSDIPWQENPVEPYAAAVVDSNSHDRREEQSQAVSEDERRLIFEQELRKLGYTIADLDRLKTRTKGRTEAEDDDEFPSHEIVNWDSLVRNATEKWTHAVPVKYEKKLCRVRTSSGAVDASSYMKHMYRTDSNDVYACQLCHKNAVYVDAVQIDEKGKAVKELEAMHLCLCLNCARKFRDMRGERPEAYDAFMERLGGIPREEIESSGPVKIPFGTEEVWFTQRHIGEIRELLRLQKKLNIENEGK